MCILATTLTYEFVKLVILEKDRYQTSNLNFQFKADNRELKQKLFHFYMFMCMFSTFLLQNS